MHDSTYRRGFGSEIESAAADIGYARFARERDLRKDFIVEPSNCSAGGAHHWLIDGSLMGCRKCGDTKETPTTENIDWNKRGVFYSDRKKKAQQLG